MGLVDVNVVLGRFAGGGACFDDVGQLQGELKRLGIGAALVHHAVAAEADIVAGNALLNRLVAGHQNLYPCWVMAPSYAGDLPSPSDWVRQARDAGVRAVRIFPRYHLYDLREWCIGPLCSALEEASLPLMIEFGPRHWSESIIPWDSIREIAREHPGLNIVIIGATVGDVRALPCLLAELPNLNAELHAFNPPDALEQLVSAGLAKQLLFGTGLPRRAAECVVGQMRAAQIGEHEFRAVAGDNAARLFGMQSPPASQTNANERRRFDVIDVHAHIGSWERTTTPVKGPEACIASMDRCGVDRMIFSSFTAIHGETRIGNVETAEAITAGRGRLFGYAVVNPNYPEESLDDLTRLFAGDSGFVGLKLHCQLHGAQLHEPGYAESLAFASAHGLPVLVHGGGHDRWDDVARRYPDAIFIMAHACSWDGRNPVGRTLYERVRHTPNLYVDVSGSAAHRGALEALIDLVGAEKIFYGSDFPMFDLGFEVGRVTLSSISDRHKELILGVNARRVFTRLR
ncbi:MAG: amidohydrolase family protein [Candidatus Hydrogenedentes bacterium]|nr:amidohydrolase family protein [Candidatus Hydrogenedentota bacterium]